MVTVRSDLYGDWIRLLSSELVSSGFPVDPSESPDSISRRYFNFRKRKIEPRRRTVLKSRQFSCPSQFVAALSTIERKVARGESLLPYLSTRMTDLDYHDQMLNAWRIHHLHLGRTALPNGFVERTDSLLFALFDTDSAYFINVYQHGMWADTDIIRVLHQNWPQMMERYRLQGVVGLEQQLSGQDHATLRSAHVNAFVEIEPGVIYGTIGGGVLLSGTSMEVVFQSNRYAGTIRQAEANLRENIEAILQENGIDVRDGELAFQLQYLNGAFRAVNLEYGIAINLGFS